MIIQGVDLSYRSTGVVVYQDGEVLDWINVKTNTSMIDDVRRNKIGERVLTVAETYKPDLIAIEDYAFGKVQGAARLGELGGVVKNKLWECDFRYCTVQPTKAKKHAGNGGYDKKQMIAAAQVEWDECPNISDVADAYWVARYTFDNFTDLIDLA